MSSSNVFSSAVTVSSSTSSSIAPASPSLIIHADEIKTGDLTAAMDIFSLGCALTELFTEGSAPFDFSQLLRYRIGDFDPSKTLEKIEDSSIKKLVESMMQKEPTARLSASEYLELQRDKAFPEYFYSFLNNYMKDFASIPRSPDEKIYRLKKDINNIIEVIISYEKHISVNESSNNKENVTSEGLVLIVSLLTSLLRALKHCSAKLNALEVLRTMANYLSPDIILDRLLPYLIFLAKDKYPKVRVAVIQTLTECLTLIKSIPKSDSNIFPEYILPNLSHIPHDEAVIVRMAYAENIAVLAETALRFLEMTQSDMEPNLDSSFLSDDERNNHSKASFDHELQALQELVQQSVTLLLSDPVNAVKQTLLERGIHQLCVFFGRQKGNDVLLSHMITYLNDKEDKHLRGAFFDAIVGVAACVGWQCCPILKPLLQQGLADSEEFVISKALCALSDLIQLGILQKQMLYDIVAEAIPLLIHPNLWIKQAAVGLVCIVAKTLNLADVQCRLIPLLQPFLKRQVIQVDQELVLLNAVQDPLPRCLLDYLIKLPSLRNFLESLSDRNISRSVTRPGLQPIYREMDSQLTTIYFRLQSDGMTEVIEDQILAMKEHLMKVHLKKASIGDVYNSSVEKNDGEIDLASLPNPPQAHSVPLTVIDHQFDKTVRNVQSKKSSKKKSAVESPTVNMNEEWQHMFGSSDLKSPPSPRLQHQNSDPSLSSYSKISASGKVLDDNLEFKTTVDGKNSVPIAILEDRHKPNHCAPCHEELQALILKKQEEWINDEIVREASDLGCKEEKPQSGKKGSKMPSGYLVAHLHEHKKAVVKIQVMPNTPLFATCSIDGTVKIWDCEKLEGKSFAIRSRVTYGRLEGPLSCMTFCENMQSIAAASDSGWIHVFRLSYENSKLSVLYQRHLDYVEEGCAVDIDFFDTGSQSVLAYATVTGSIVGWDLRSPGTAWKLENNPRQGLVTSFCTDPHHCWIVVGTASGNMICWDLRFQLPITSITHPTGSRIRHLLVHPKKKSAIFAAVQGNNEVSLWDLETQGRLTTLWSINNAPPLSQTEASDDSVYSMCWSATDHGSTLLTAGSDRRIRYWDLKNPAASHIVVGAANDPLAPFSNINYTSRIIDGTQVICENFTRQKDEKAMSSEDQPRRYPETPPAGHHDCISSIASMYTSQPLILSASKDGVVKIWK
ncbi:phosphoinositide 3-kinase regulatory subunit 4-like isoform X1 [Stegodyphus dumicola]|uniref:phosphoinositide 3-kinase regulatory subunit 4-like isoform X1 n=1 Tax=Stegodyphus dumicola TaxID=202533 RepID=UPI0015ACA38D|nr:phosphoinositide 3-kinase regulatory subunit 4-like isoform X1 [Stegodyphus dumicola]